MKESRAAHALNARGCAENELRVRLSPGMPEAFDFHRKIKDSRAASAANAANARELAEDELRVRLSMGGQIVRNSIGK